MGASALVISSANIEPQEFEQLIETLGGVALSAKKDDFVVSFENTSVWVGFQTEEFSKDFYDEEDMQLYSRALNSPPKTFLELRLDHTNLSCQLYMYIAYRIGLKWRIILEDISEEIVQFDEIKTRCSSNVKELQ
jgi:hypothetical protein